VGALLEFPFLLDPSNYLLFELGREDSTAIGFSGEVSHDEPPFYPLS
jgi:hypothetical protein